MESPSSPPPDAAWWDHFRRLLDEQTTWPVRFPMKFIVPADKVAEAEARFEGHTLRLRPSSKGTFVSVSLDPEVASADDVVALYQAAGAIEGAVLL